MKDKVLKVVKFLTPLVSIGVTLATNYFENKELDDKVAKKVTEALAKTAGKES